MTECERAQQISAYYDGELPASAVAEFEEHLRQCPDCAAELADLRELSRLVGKLAEPKIPSHLLHRLHRSADYSSRAGIWRMAKAISAVAAIVLLVCSSWLWHLSGSDVNAGESLPWEAFALRSTDFPAQRTSDEQLAIWIIEDLGGQ
ncbi:MAG: zf-HC2 domain-containing protein [Planctomycetota bacterium]|nr:zf-HC2 domain-containing protein [Planctomycetota bacterium]